MATVKYPGKKYRIGETEFMKLAELVAPFYNEERVTAYKDAKFSEVRYLWDGFWAADRAGRVKGVSMYDTLICPIYDSGANDTHIESCLRNIATQLNARY